MLDCCCFVCSLSSCSELVHGLLTVVVFPVAECRLEALAGFNSCRTPVQWLWHTGLVVPQHVESSQTRDQTCVPCIGRQILILCTTREIPVIYFK